MESILNSVKKVLNLAPTYDAFDQDIILFINATFSTLEQLGVGPDGGFAISGDTEVWADFMGDDHRFNAVKSYVYLRARMLFDPPTTSYLIDAMERQIKELEWRLNVVREDYLAAAASGEEFILDGGGP